MFAALVVWGVSAAWTLSPVVEHSAGAALIVLVCYAFWNTKRGRCPRCVTPIRFEPRMGLPKTCGGCGLDFSANVEPEQK